MSYRSKYANNIGSYAADTQRLKQKATISSLFYTDVKEFLKTKKEREETKKERFQNFRNKNVECTRVVFFFFFSFSHKLFSSCYHYCRGMQVLLQYAILRSTQSGIKLCQILHNGPYYIEISQLNISCNVHRIISLANTLEKIKKRFLYRKIHTHNLVRNKVNKTRY